MRKRWLVLLCLLLVGSGAALWLWSAQRSETLPSLLLPGSNRVQLVAVTVGTNARINFGTPIERVLGRLPGKLGRRFRVNEVWSFSATANPTTDVVLWFRYERLPPPGSYLRAQIVEQGEQGRAPVYSGHSQMLSNGVIVSYSGTHLWPRRTRTLTFRVEQGLPSNESVPIGELTVANPAYRDYPIWVPEKLPATRNFGNTSFVLEYRRYHQTHVRVMSGGKAERNWEVWARWLRDATGNLVATREPPQSGEMRRRADSGGIITVYTWTHGMPIEPAWKVGFQFVRAGSLASNEVFVLRGVPAISTGARSSWTWETNLAAGLVAFNHQPDWEDSSRRPCLVSYVPESVDLANSGKSPLAVVILGAVNDAGQAIPVVDERKIHIPPGSKTLDITIGIPLQHCVEYTIDPRILDESGRSVQATSTPDYLKVPDTVRPEKILRELNK